MKKAENGLSSGAWFDRGRQTSLWSMNETNSYLQMSLKAPEARCLSARVQCATRRRLLVGSDVRPTTPVCPASNA